MKSPLTPDQKYYSALKFFNDNVADYQAYYKAVSSETQAKWKKNIDPLIQSASDALDAWKVSLTGDKEKAWISARDLFIAALFQYNILSIGG